MTILKNIILTLQDLHIKVLDNTHVKKENINCLVVLAWQHQEVIIKKYTNFIKNNGLLIIPLPKFKIIKKNLNNCLLNEQK